MVVTAELSNASQRAEWFASWFDSEHYHRLYADRSDVEAADLIDTLIARLRPLEGSTVLDLGCGSGRHSRRFAARGLDVTGLDLSASSLARALPYEGPHLRFRRQDMRTPFGVGAFDYVFSTGIQPQSVFGVDLTAVDSCRDAECRGFERTVSCATDSCECG